MFPAASPPSQCPMHKAEAGPAHQDRAYEFVGCPMKAAAATAAADNSDIDPSNMVSETCVVCRHQPLECIYISIVQQGLLFDASSSHVTCELEGCNDIVG